MRTEGIRLDDGDQCAAILVCRGPGETLACLATRPLRLPLVSRLGRIITVLSAHGVDGALVGGICRTAVDLLEADGAGLALLANGHLSSICAHGVMAEIGEELQFTLGEGPTRDAMAGGVLVESDALPTDSRWPMFASGIAHTEAVSIAAFPVRIGGARIGALTVYRKEPVRLSADQAADGYVLAQVAAHVILAAQAGVTDDGLMAEMEAGFARMEPVHQATGMIMGQLGVGAEEAAARLRSAAFVADRPIIDFAGDVIEGRTTLSGDADLLGA